MTEPTEQARSWLDALVRWWPMVTAPTFPAWALWRYFRKARTDDAAQDLRLLQAENNRDAVERRRQDDVDEKQVARLTAEIGRLEVALDRVTKDRDRGWNLARWWFDRAHDMGHLAANARMLFDSERLLRSAAAGVWGEALTLPPFEDPYPKSKDQP